MKTLAEALPEEMVRVRAILDIYKQLGPVGAFGAAGIEQSLQAAEKAILNGDTVAMIKAYEDLRDIED